MCGEQVSKERWVKGGRGGEAQAECGGRGRGETRQAGRSRVTRLPGHRRAGSQQRQVCLEPRSTLGACDDLSANSVPLNPSSGLGRRPSARRIPTAAAAALSAGSVQGPQPVGTSLQRRRESRGAEEGQGGMGGETDVAGR